MKKRDINKKKMVKEFLYLFAISLVVIIIFGLDFISNHKFWFLIPFFIVVILIIIPQYDE